ncbi:MAG: ABC transporter permease [Pirellulales bacterium]|nr:ABC transporter permease [Pirellulales bacterium]
MSSVESTSLARQVGSRLVQLGAGRMFPIMPWAIARHFYARGNLVRQMLRREILGRYEGSFLGLFWCVLNPLLMLAVYTFIFSVVFQRTWGVDPNETVGSYAVVLYAGLVVFYIFAEVATPAPSIVTSNPNLVTKVVFPLEILPLVRTLAALVRALPSVVILFFSVWIVQGYVPWTFVLFPLVVVPMALLTLGVAYFLAFLGVFVRDVAHSMGMIIRIVFYLSPVFYPISIVPERLRSWLWLHPIARIVEDSRSVTVFGQLPDWGGLAVATLLSALIAWLGYVVFMSFKHAFADVI